jgi:hypothetical protein
MTTTDIPMRAGDAPTCPDCYHRPHFRTACDCGCPSGIERKQQRDADVTSAKGDSTRPAQGFY